MCISYFVSEISVEIFQRYLWKYRIKGAKIQPDYNFFLSFELPWVSFLFSISSESGLMHSADDNQAVHQQ